MSLVPTGLRRRVEAQGAARGDAGRQWQDDARAHIAAAAVYFDLENPRDEARLAEPLLALERLRGLVVLDEVQRRPDLFPLLRVLADRRPLPARFLLLGSASPWLVRGVSESLAGRVAFVDMGGFSLDDVGVRRWRKLWFRGAFPEAFRARSAAASAAWRESFVGRSWAGPAPAGVE
jgi:predicted AAA+ superfamily ATPase